MSKELNSNKLNGKDLINAGIFSAIYVVIIMLVACTVGMIPIGFILLTLLVPLLEGIPMMLYFSKIKKVGMIMILQVVIGLAMIITGMGYDLLIWGIVTGIIAEIIMKVTKYKKGIACVLAYAVSCICIAGNYVHWIGASDEWLASKAAGYGEVYMNTIAGYFKIWWVFPVMIILCFLGGLIGGLIGRKVMKNILKEWVSINGFRIISRKGFVKAALS